MIIEIQHRTSYQYSSAARLDLQTIRLKPRADARHKILSFDLAVSPQPTFKSEGVDEEGNVMVWVRVDGALDHFEVKTHSRVETVPVKVDETMLAPGGARLPMTLPTKDAPGLLRYLQPPWVDPSVLNYATMIADSVGMSTLDFLQTLAFRIHKDHTYQARIQGPPFTPDVTLAQRQGTCRDFTVLFMEACRAFDIPTRFVSGYHVRERDNAGRELHAWAEAFLPGFGWQGYDPTIGKVVHERHVPVAASATPIGAAPIEGSLWGTNVTSRLEATVEARILPAPVPSHS